MSFEFPDPVDPTETVSRFLLEKGGRFAPEANEGRGRVKYRAFLWPNPPAPAEISVYRTGELDEEITWAIGRDHVGTTEKPVLARGDLEASVAYKLGLNLEPTANPHPRHTNITGFPNTTEKRVIAEKLADACTLHVAPSSASEQSL